MPHTWGRVKEFAHPARTFCDYDKPRKPPSAAEIAWVAATLGMRPLWCRLDRTRRGWHLIVQWQQKRNGRWRAADLKPAEAVAIQAILGSDPKREALNLMRTMSDYDAAGRRRWNILYAEKIT